MFVSFQNILAEAKEMLWEGGECSALVNGISALIKNRQLPARFHHGRTQWEEPPTKNRPSPDTATVHTLISDFQLEVLWEIDLYYL